MREMSERQKWVCSVSFAALLILFIVGLSTGKLQKGINKVIFPQKYWQDRIAEIEKLIRTKEKLMEYDLLELKKKTLIVPVEMAQDEILGFNAAVTMEAYQKEIENEQSIIDITEKSIERSKEELEEVRRQLKRFNK